MSLSRTCPWALVGLLVLAGCGGDDPSQKKSAGTDDTLIREADTITGRWLLRLTNITRGFDLPYAILEVDDDGKVEIVERTGLLTDAEIEEVAVDGKTFHLRAKLEDGEVLDAVGELREGVVWGNAVIEDKPVIFPIRLLETNEDSLELIEATTTAGWEEFARIQRSGDSRMLQEFVAKRPSTPLSLLVSETLLYLAKRDGLDAEGVRQRMRLYERIAEPWGERYVRHARFSSARALAAAGHHPEIAREILGNLDEGTATDWAETISDLESELDIIEARLTLEGTDEDAKEAAAATLREEYAEDAGDPIITFALARYADATKDTEAALKLYGEIVALPELENQLVGRWRLDDVDYPLPTDRFRELWKEAHPDADDAERKAFLDRIYAERATTFVGEPPAAEGNRVCLVELFTGAQCNPCKAADLAIAGAEELIDHDHMIALRYHQHIPGPDPFANPSSETRFDYYASTLAEQGTPTVAVGGRVVSPGGPQEDAIVGLTMNDAARSHEALLRLMTPILAEKTDVAIELSAKADGATLHVTANVTGLPDPAAEKLRLRVVVAEAEFPFVARNGIRHHEMVVRWMLPSSDGTAPKDGKLSLDATYQLPDLVQQLTDALDDFENARNIDFPERPMRFEKFVVVAFVQDDEPAEDGTRPIMQAVAVPLEGKPVFKETGPSASGN